MFPELNTNTIQSEKRRPQLAETSPNSYPFNAMIHVADFKNQILTPNELAKITNSSYTGQNEVQEKFQREKEQLHKDSLERVKTWGNTVLGKRMRRLNAIQKRDELAEEGRREIDASWKKVQEKEHTEALNRAQSIQDRQEPQMRDLFSRLNLGEIIRERNMQLDIKKRDLHNQQLYDEMYRRDAVKDFIKLTKRDQSRLIQAKNERLKLAQYQSNQSKDKLGYERAVKNDNYEFYLKVNENNKLEEAASIQMLRKQRKSLKDDFKSDLEKGIDEKQKLMHEQNIFDAKVDNENRAFTRVKDYITEKTKSIATEKLE